MKPRKQQRKRPEIEEFEPRILYSADFAALLQQAALAPSSQVRMLGSVATAPPFAALLPVKVLPTTVRSVDPVA